MENLDFIDFGEVLNREYGPIGTPRRDNFEQKVDESVHSWKLGEATQKTKIELLDDISNSPRREMVDITPSISAAKLLKNIDKSYDSGKNLLDESMKQTAEIIDILRAYKPDAVVRYGINRLGLFGSVARGQHHEGSDIDVCFEGGNPTLLTIARMEIELEALTGSKVHVTVYHDGLPERMKERINEDVIWV